MKAVHGIIFAYSAEPALRELVAERTAASLPFCGRYRLIDLALSSMTNAGIRDVGVIMQRDYQSLLDHMGSGKAWDMSRKSGGLRMLPPFGLPAYHRGNYSGTMEALNAVSSYIKDIKEDYIALMLGNICANIDLSAAIRQHIASGRSITAICTQQPMEGSHFRYALGENGLVRSIRFDSDSGDEGLDSTECYVINKKTLVEMMDRCAKLDLRSFHRDAISHFLASGGDMGVYVHTGYAMAIHTVDAYYKANMDMLKAENRRRIFPADRPVRTRNHEEVSTYYGENACSKNSLVADNCIIEGTVENSIVFSGVHIAKGAVVRNAIVMRGCEIGEWAELNYVIADKACSFAAGTTLTGSPKLPLVAPKKTKI